VEQIRARVQPLEIAGAGLYCPMAGVNIIRIAQLRGIRWEFIVATYGLPSSEKILAAIGKIALRHGQLENSLRRLINRITVAVEGLAGGYERDTARRHCGGEAVLPSRTQQWADRAACKFRALGKQLRAQGGILIALRRFIRRARQNSELPSPTRHRSF
jgi:hypothetical protein